MSLRKFKHRHLPWLSNHLYINMKGSKHCSCVAVRLNLTAITLAFLSFSCTSSTSSNIHGVRLLITLSKSVSLPQHWIKIGTNVYSVEWPQQRTNHAATHLSGSLFVIVGGLARSYHILNDMWLCDTTTKLWKMVLFLVTGLCVCTITQTTNTFWQKLVWAVY